MRAGAPLTEAPRREARVVLVTRFRLAALAKDHLLAGRRRAVAYFYDPYGKLHGPLFLAACRLMGQRRLEAVTAALAGLLRLPIRAVPHGRRVAGYANLQLGASIDAGRCLDALRRKSSFQAPALLPEGAMKDEEIASLYLKHCGVRCWQLIENIRVVKLLTSVPVEVYVNRCDWPDGLLEQLAHDEGISIVDKGRQNNLPDLAIAFLAMLARIPSWLARLRRPGRAAEKVTYAAATEVIDPEAFQGKPAQPNYLVGDGLPAERVLFYIQPQQRRLFKENRPAPLEGYTIVDLERLGLDQADLVFLLRGCWKILRVAAREGAPLASALTYLDFLYKYALLTALFKHFNVGVHLHNSYPQGRVRWRPDSGLVTAACRRQGVHSLSYQTRAHFGAIVEYYFDCYDTYCLWGAWWESRYRDHIFVKDIRIIGNVFLDAYTRRQQLAGVEAHSPSLTKTVVLFPCDIHLDEPSYLTLDYAVEFLRATIGAATRLNRGAGVGRYEVAIKPKHPWHIEAFRQHPGLSASAHNGDLKITYFPQCISDVQEVIASADYVLSLLPTTPGLEALLLGKPSAYFNALDWNDQKVEGYPGIVRNEREIEQFLSGQHPAGRGLLDRLDPYRDGKAGERLRQIVRAAGRRPETRAALGVDR